VQEQLERLQQQHSRLQQEYVQGIREQEVGKRQVQMLTAQLAQYQMHCLESVVPSQPVVSLALPENVCEEAAVGLGTISKECTCKTAARGELGQQQMKEGRQELDLLKRQYLMLENDHDVLKREHALVAFPRRALAEQLRSVQEQYSTLEVLRDGLQKKVEEQQSVHEKQQLVTEATLVKVASSHLQAATNTDTCSLKAAEAVQSAVEEVGTSVKAIKHKATEQASAHSLELMESKERLYLLQQDRDTLEQLLELSKEEAKIQHVNAETTISALQTELMDLKLWKDSAFEEAAATTATAVTEALKAAQPLLLRQVEDELRIGLLQLDNHCQVPSASPVDSFVTVGGNRVTVKLTPDIISNLRSLCGSMRQDMASGVKTQVASVQATLESEIELQRKQMRDLEHQQLKEWEIRELEWEEKHQVECRAREDERAALTKAMVEVERNQQKV
jgi:hypothetical protein